MYSVYWRVILKPCVNVMQINYLHTHQDRKGALMPGVTGGPVNVSGDPDEGSGQFYIQ